jgi:hypothetical protein
MQPNESVEDYSKKRLADEVVMIRDELSSVASSDRARLPERIFVGVFLPFFAADKDPAYPVNMGNWINVATSPYKGVDVIDATGKVLFTVPPVFNRETVNPVSDETVPLAHVVKSAHQLANVHPKQGSAYLNQELTKRALVMKTATNVLNNVEVWNEIFKRYGREPLVKLNEEAGMADTGQTVSAKGNDDYEFELL